MPSSPIRLATRSSALALAQAEDIKSTIEAHHREVELVEVSTTGDEIDDALIQSLGTTGAFVRQLDREVLDGTVDAAVHSMKDVPTDQPEELVTAAIPPRGAPGDVLVAPAGKTLTDLPEGAGVGTGSLRRQAQLRRARPDLVVEGIRGNVDTRLAKLYASVEDASAIPEPVRAAATEREPDTQFDALVLARAGLERAGLISAVPAVDLESFVPAPGQGALAITTRDTDFAAWLNETLDDPRTRVETTVERCILATIGGGCVAPIGIHAIIQGETVKTDVFVASRDGEDVIEATEQLPVDKHVEAARRFAQTLVDSGARDLIEEATRGEPGPAHRNDDDA